MGRCARCRSWLIPRKNVKDVCHQCGFPVCSRCTPLLAIESDVGHEEVHKSTSRTEVPICTEECALRHFFEFEEGILPTSEVVFMNEGNVCISLEERREDGTVRYFGYIWWNKAERESYSGPHMIPVMVPLSIQMRNHLESKGHRPIDRYVELK